MDHKEYIMETSVWTSKYEFNAVFSFFKFQLYWKQGDCILNVIFFSDDDSGTMKVLTDTDDEPPPLPPKVSTSPQWHARSITTCQSWD